MQQQQALVETNITIIAVRTPVEHIIRRESQAKEELMVSNDVMRLEVKRLRDTLNGAADEVFSLENRRQQLAMSMKERKAEIQVMIYSTCSMYQQYTCVYIGHADEVKGKGPCFSTADTVFFHSGAYVTTGDTQTTPCGII